MLLSKKIKLKKFLKLGLSLLTVSLLAACVTSQNFTEVKHQVADQVKISAQDLKTVADLKQQKSENPNYYISKIVASNSQYLNNQYILEAVDLLIGQAKPDAASYYLEQYKAGQHPGQDQEYAVLNEALHGSQTSKDAPTNQDIKYFRDGIKKINDFVNSSQYHAALQYTDQLYYGLHQSYKQSLINHTWSWIKVLTPDVLNNIIKNAIAQGDSLVVLWANLAQLYQENRNNTANLQIALSQWLEDSAQYNHPAQQTLPSDLQGSTATLYSAHTKDDLFAILPLSGKLANYGKAVQKGIMAANQDTGNKSQIDYIDSVKLDDSLDTIATKPVQGIIGPLDDNSINKVVAVLDKNGVNNQISSPILILNNNALAHVCRLNYGIKDQAVTAANFVANNKYRNPVVLYPANSNNNKIAADVFAERWLTLKSSHPVLLSYQDKESVKQLLLEQFNKSPLPDLIYFIGNHQEFQDFYSVLTNEFFNQTVAVIVNDQIVVDGFTKSKRIDLNGVYITGDPLVVEQDSLVYKKAIDNLGVTAVDLTRLYSYGYDAFITIQNLEKIKSTPSYRLNSLSSVIYNTGDCQIGRDVNVYQINNGEYQKVK